MEEFQYPIDPTPETHPELVWSHRDVSVRYTFNAADPATLYAWIEVGDRKLAVTERLLRVITTNPEHRRRSFLAAVVARIDEALDSEHGAWCSVHH